MLVRITPEAERQIAAIRVWWREHRQSAPNLFAEELASALDLVARLPRAGRRRRHLSVPRLRRLLLRSSRYHVYYAPALDTLFVLAVWNAHRGLALISRSNCDGATRPWPFAVAS
jgi:plasmid stabilization system protein ParE